MNEITLIGHVGRDIRLNRSRDRQTAVLGFSIALNDRQFDRRTREWVDRPTVWQDVVTFGARAENAYETLTRGMAVVVVGKLADNSYTREDDTISRTQLLASHIAVDLSTATAEVTKVIRSPECATNGDEVVGAGETAG